MLREIKANLFYQPENRTTLRIRLSKVDTPKMLKMLHIRALDSHLID